MVSKERSVVESGFVKVIKNHAVEAQKNTIMPGWRVVRGWATSEIKIGTVRFGLGRNSTDID